jgi:serine O-acetyltransferase
MGDPGHPRHAPPVLDQQQIDESIDRLTTSILGDERIRHLSTRYLPARAAVIRLVEHLTDLVYPGFFESRHFNEQDLRDQVGRMVRSVGEELATQVSGSLRYQRDLDTRDRMFEEHSADCDDLARQIVGRFVKALPDIRLMLSLDVQAAYDGDPAARHTDEVVFCYPGIRALTVHRLAHTLYREEVTLLPRIMSEYAHARTGIDIHPGAKIGKSFFIDHGTGVVIGETTVIGDHCKIYQGVTLGAKSFPKDERGRVQRGVKRHPTLEDHVTVYAGATILGGDTVIGSGSVINGGVFLTSSVPPGHVVRGPKADLTLRNNPEMPPQMYSI